jgi:hypothetical protein
MDSYHRVLPLRDRVLSRSPQSQLRGVMVGVFDDILLEHTVERSLLHILIVSRVGFHKFMGDQL